MIIFTHKTKSGKKSRNFMCISERIKQYADYKDISISSIEKKIGASDGLIRKSIAKKSDIQAKWIAVISENYPDIDIKWLLTGKGDMLRTSTPARSESPTSYVAPKEESSDSIAMLLRDMLREKDELLARQQEEIGRLKAELAAAEAKLAELDYHDSDDAPDVGMPPSVLAG